MAKRFVLFVCAVFCLSFMAYGDQKVDSRATSTSKSVLNSSEEGGSQKDTATASEGNRQSGSMGAVTPVTTKVGPKSVESIVSRSQSVAMANANAPTTTVEITTITFDNDSASCTIGWTATVKNTGTVNAGTTFFLNAFSGPQWRSAGGGPVGNILPGQTKNISGTFSREYNDTSFKTVIKASGVLVTEKQVNLPPDHTYAAAIQSVGIEGSNVVVTFRNTGNAAIPLMGVQFLKGNSSSPSQFSAHAGQGVPCLAVGQTTTVSHVLPAQWGAQYNVIRVDLTRGTVVYDSRTTQ